MRKLLTILLATALVLNLGACGGKDSPSGGTDDPNSIQTPAENPPAAPDTETEQEDRPSSAGKEPTAPDQGAVKPEEPQPAEPSEPEKPEESGEAEPVKRVSHEDVTLRYAGESFRLTVWDSNGRDPDACTYTSADPSVATVDETGGEVTAAAPGTTTVTAHVTFGDETLDFDCIVRCAWEEKEENLPAAGGEEEPVPPPAEAADTLPSLTDFFATLQGSYEGLGAMMVIEGEVLDAYYPGLSSAAAVEEILIQETRMSMSNVAVGLVKFSDEATTDDILAVQAIFQARMTTQAEGGAWYPASCEAWEQGVTTSVSQYLGMFVYPDGAQSMADLFTETFSN